MTIPLDIRIFNIVYESGKYLLPALLVLWLVWLIYVIIKKERKQFLLTPITLPGQWILYLIFFKTISGNDVEK